MLWDLSLKGFFPFLKQIIRVRLGNLLHLLTLGNQVSDVENFHMV